MSEEEQQTLSIKRILVALDASPHSLAALEAAVELAARFQAELAGLFVEDESLLRAANLPFVHEVGTFSATRRRIDGEELERQIRVQSRRARRVFAIQTERAQVTWSFSVVRGTVLSEVLTAASEADVLVLGKLGWSLVRRGRVGSTVRGILPERFGLALIMEEGTCLGTPLAVVYDDSPAAERALTTADVLRREPGIAEPLIVLVLAKDPDEAERLQSRAEAHLTERGGQARYRTLTQANMLQLVDALQAEGCGTLVLPAHGATLKNSALESLLENLDLPVLLVT